VAPTLISLLQEAVVRYPSLAVLKAANPDGGPLLLTYAELYEAVRDLGTGLATVGLAKGTHVAIVAENGWRWLVTDLAVLGCGAADVPLSATLGDRELEYVLNHADCEMAVVESTALVARIAAFRRRVPKLRRIIVMEPGSGPRPRLDREAGRILVHSWEDVIAKGRARLARGDRQFDLRAAGITSADTATILYAHSGGSRPRGVMLSHGNIMHNVTSINTRISPSPGDGWLSVLPIWRIAERVAEYVSLSFGSTIIYSRPSEWRIFDDLREHRPGWLVVDPQLLAEIAHGIEKRVGPLASLAIRFEKFYGVFAGFIAGRYPRYRREERALEIFAAILPLVLFSPVRLLSSLVLGRKVGALVGGGLRAIICGGSVTPGLDRYFYAIGITLLEGYGLPEASPIVSLRSEKAPLLGTAGKPLPLTEVQVVDDAGEPLPFGRSGNLRVRGPQVMQGYYKDEAGTREVLSPDGWLVTGDTALATLDGSLVILGRALRTITLRTGEELQPEPLEEALESSPYIRDAVVVGDHRELPGLLIVPEVKELARWARAHDIPFEVDRELVHNPAVFRMLQEEVQARLVGSGIALPGGRTPRLAVLPSRFEVGRELSQGGAKRREAIDRLYEGVISRMYRG
jgi:long-chain acyl-CoA synthetase